MEPRVSIVVPVYRVENYLGQCVESLLAQTLRDMEIILVDDGSPDGSGAIADNYAAQDRRVRVIHQSNAGLGPARNAGIAAARGEYIGFVDSDDWVTPEMFERLYEAARQCRADIAVSGHRDVAQGRVLVTKVHPLAGQTLQGEAEIQPVRMRLFGHAPQDRETEAFPMSVCMSLYRREVVERGQLRFCHILSEDTLFNLQAYRCARIITFTGGTDYCYRKEGQPSITRTFCQQTPRRFAQFLQELYSLAEKEGEEALLRAQKTAIDYCRLYVGMVADSELGHKEKRAAIRRFARCGEIRRCWAGYPVETLPLRQRVFHRAVLSGRYGLALTMYGVRRYGKRRGGNR